MKGNRFKVWLHVEEIDDGGDPVKGDDNYPPYEIGEYTREKDALEFRDAVIDMVESARRAY